MKTYLLTAIWILVISAAHSQTIVQLYPGGIPNSKPTRLKEQKTFEGIVDTILRNVSEPTLTIFKPASANGTAVIVIPGGGYHALLISREGNRLAKAFNEKGITAFVLKYRLPNNDIMLNKSIAPLQDIQQAIQLVRSNAKSWGMNVNKLGVLGFSAGGHLAASAGVHSDSSFVNHKSGISLRPDFMILVNPVISFTDSIGHTGSRTNLIGEHPSVQQIKYFSAEQNITTTTPPTLLIHTDDDTVVPVENSLVFYHQLRQNKVPASLHIYTKGEHGFLQRPSLNEWFGRCIFWMEEMDFIPAP